MTRPLIASRGRIRLLIAAGLAPWAGIAFAGKPEGAGEGPGKGKGASGDPGRGQSPSSQGAPAAATGFAFTAADRRIAIEFYGTQAKAGRCPPGLAKKGNGCQPPGQAKRWQRGRPLPADLVFHDIPVELRIRLPRPPADHRYVEIAGDILLVAIGTMIVVDALEDLFG